jgi:hypothetical protein
MPAENLAGQIVADVEAASAQVNFRQRASGVDTFAPDRERVQNALFATVVFGGRDRRLWRFRAAAPALADKPEAVPNVVSACPPAVASVRERQESLGCARRYSDAHATVLGGVAGAWRDDLATNNLAAQCPSYCTKVAHRPPPLAIVAAA